MEASGEDRQQIQRLIKKATGREASEALLDYLEESRHIRGVLGGVDYDEELGILLKVVGDLRRFESATRDQSRKKRPVLKEGTRGSRLGAMSLLLAEEARKSNQVDGFRKGGLWLADPLQWNEVEDWIKRQSKDDLKAFEKALEDNDPQARIVLKGIARDSYRPSSTEHSVLDSLEFVRYRNPDDPRDRLWPAAPMGVLEDLIDEAESLAAEFHWDVEDATVFLLTDIEPDVSDIRINLSLNPAVSSLSRITLEIDPALRADRVAEAYRQARRQLVPGRVRPQSERHLYLAAFEVKGSRDTKGSELMKKWNDTCKREGWPENWPYTQVTNFLRDVKKARERLLHPPYEMPERDKEMKVNG